MSIFTGSEIVAMMSFQVTATPNMAGGADYSTVVIASSGMNVGGTPVDHGAYIEIPVTLDYPLGNDQQIAFLSLHYNPAGPHSPDPFVARVGGAAVALADGNVGVATDILINVNPAAFPLAGTGLVEFHYLVMKVPFVA